MKNKADPIKSPDDTALYCVKVLMAFFYRRYGLNPLFWHFYPLQGALLFVLAAYLDVSVRVDGSYAVLAAALVGWLWMARNANRSLRLDARAEWTARLYSKYEAVTTGMRERFAAYRLAALFLALFVSWDVAADLGGGFSDLAVWHRVAVAGFVWAVAFFGYARSAELPVPGDGGSAAFSRGRFA